MSKHGEESVTLVNMDTREENLKAEVVKRIPRGHAEITELSQAMRSTKNQSKPMN